MTICRKQFADSLGGDEAEIREYRSVLHARLKTEPRPSFTFTTFQAEAHLRWGRSCEQQECLVPPMKLLMEANAATVTHALRCSVSALSPGKLADAFPRCPWACLVVWPDSLASGLEETCGHILCGNIGTWLDFQWMLYWTHFVHCG